MSIPTDPNSILRNLFLPLEVSELDRQRCAAFLNRAGWNGMASLGDPDSIRSHLSISRAPALILQAAIDLQSLTGEAVSGGELTLEAVCDDLRRLAHEELRGIYMDELGHIVHAQTLAIGTIERVEISPYAAFRPAFVTGTRRMSLAHNHPSQDDAFSITDMAAFSRLRKVANEIGIDLESLIVVTETGISIREM